MLDMSNTVYRQMRSLIHSRSVNYIAIWPLQSYLKTPDHVR